MEEKMGSKPTTILTDEEFRRVIQEVCKYNGSSFSAMVRMLFRREQERINAHHPTPLVVAVSGSSKEPTSETATTLAP
jgi:tRNA-dihydrouridine synthase